MTSRGPWELCTGGGTLSTEIENYCPQSPWLSPALQSHVTHLMLFHMLFYQEGQKNISARPTAWTEFCVHSTWWFMLEVVNISDNVTIDSVGKAWK